MDLADTVLRAMMADAKICNKRRRERDGPHSWHYAAGNQWLSQDTRECRHCGKSYKAKQWNQVWCGASCKNMDFAKRRRESA